MRLKHLRPYRSSARCPCGKGAGFSDEIETNEADSEMGSPRCGKGAGFSDEIETWEWLGVLAALWRGGKGAGFSDEIETFRSGVL